MNMEYYDAVLGLIPVLFLIGGIVIFLVGVSNPTVVLIPGFLSIGVIFHAMFVQFPTGPSSPSVNDVQ